MAIAQVLEWYLGCDDCAETRANINADLDALADKYTPRLRLRVRSSEVPGELLVVVETGN